MSLSSRYSSSCLRSSVRESKIFSTPTPSFCTLFSSNFLQLTKVYSTKSQSVNCRFWAKNGSNPRNRDLYRYKTALQKIACFLPVTPPRFRVKQDRLTRGDFFCV